ncbi:MAG: recombinase RecQ, partial [Thermoleophilia bacterium]|nr:recombinase RecQ [Thermoleophilia bacterium]
MTTDDNDMRLWPAPGETATIPGRTASSIAAATARTGPELRARGEELLRTSLGPDAAFRDGQWDAIELLVTGRARLLVEQRTGWGKSSVYFITTRLLREQGAGPTVLVSPLLALMRDQIRAAERLGVKAARIDSTNMEEWGSVV